MSKEQWIEEVYKLLWESSGSPKGKAAQRNLRGYATLMADAESGYFQEGMTPQEAFDEEASCG